MKNKEGYLDITASKAIKATTKQEKRNKDFNACIELLKLVINKFGFELVDRIYLKDRATGKEYR